MANTNAVHGFLPVRMKDGGSCIPTMRMAVSASNGAFEMGDLLAVDATGTITGRAANGAAAGTIAGVAAHTKAASAGGTVLVWNSPNIVFEGQSSTGTPAQTHVGNNTDIINTAPSGGVSQQSFDIANAAVTATFPFKIYGLYPVVGNAFGANARLEVIFNKGFGLGAGDGSTGI